MREENNKSSAARREELYTKVLVISTAAMLLFVFIVFLAARGQPASTEYDTNTADDTASQTTPQDLPAHVLPLDYIPKTTDSTAPMDDALLDAAKAILVDLETNTVLASLGADRKIYPASMTKIMTLIVAVENITDLEDTFTISSDIVERAYAAGASTAGFSAGETVTILDLLYGAAVSSGADATDALALYVAGSEAEFVKLMNQKADALGLTATNFANSSGLHNDDTYSTVREIAAIMAYAMENELISKLLSAKSYTTSPTEQHPSGITLYSTAFSRMSTYTYGAVTLIAAKSGFTDEARFCLASYGTTADGRAFILITAHGSDRYSPALDCAYAYRTFVK